MTRSTEEKRAGVLRRGAAWVLAALVASCIGLVAAPVALAETADDLPGTYQLPLKASDAASRMAADTPASEADSAGADQQTAPAAGKPAPSADAAAGSTAGAPGTSAGDPSGAAGATSAEDSPGASADLSAGEAEDGSAHSAAAANADADADVAARDAAADAGAAASDQASAPVGATAAAKVADGAGKAKAAGEARAASAAKAMAATASPLSFTVSGKKFLEGRSLSAGEFTFTIAAAGAARVPAASSLPNQLRPPSTLTDDEKYELVANGGLVYYPLAQQPMPASATTTNNADGEVSFGPLTFDLTCLGESGTQRHQGTVFCYTVTEQPPRNADGSLKDGVTRDELGRYVYQGVTYDDSVKRVYLYVYETGDDSGNPEIAVIPLGSATFNDEPVKAIEKPGEGFLNVFNGAVLDAFDGAVYLAGEPISAGEFNFDVKEVAEDGTVIDDHAVSCEAAENGSDGAGVHLIADEIYGQPGRFFYAVTQLPATRTAAEDIVLDESSYIVTVEVTKSADSDDLSAAVTYVRKKPAGSDRWVDVALDAQPSPVTWENHVKAPDEPDQPGGDEPDGGDKPGGDEPDGGDKPDGGDGGGALAPGDGDADAENPGANDDAAKPDEGASGSGANDEGASSSAGDGGDNDGSASSGAAAAGQASGSASSKAKAPGSFAQTGDDLGVPMLIAFLIVVASGVILAIASRRRTPRP